MQAVPGKLSLGKHSALTRVAVFYGRSSTFDSISWMLKPPRREENERWLGSLDDK